MTTRPALAAAIRSPFTEGDKDFTIPRPLCLVHIRTKNESLPARHRTMRLSFIASLPPTTYISPTYNVDCLFCIDLLLPLSLHGLPSCVPLRLLPPRLQPGHRVVAASLCNQDTELLMWFVCEFYGTGYRFWERARRMVISAALSLHA